MTTTTRRGPLADPLFRLLWVGGALASVSEQLFVICLTLLVLDVAGAGAGAALGTVLAVAAVPRAVLLPLGGVLADRVDPARIVGAESAGDLFGPALAAGIVTAAGLGGGLGSVAGLYVLAAVVLTAFARRWLRTPPPTAPVGTPTPTDGPRSGGGALVEGLRYAWGEPVVRTILLVLALLNVAVIGPVLVGGAVLAEQRLGGPAALGLVFAGFGAGSLVGLVTAGARAPRRRGPVLVLGTAVIGAGTAGFALVGDLGTAVAVAALIGVGEGYLGVVLVSWLQERVPEGLRGRVLSLVVLAVAAFDPLSYALAGALLPLGTAALFVVCGALVLVGAGVAAASPAVRSLR